MSSSLSPAAVEECGQHAYMIALLYVDHSKISAPTVRDTPEGTECTGARGIAFDRFRVLNSCLHPRPINASFGQHIFGMSREDDPGRRHVKAGYSAALGNVAPAATCLLASSSSIATIRPSAS